MKLINVVVFNGLAVLIKMLTLIGVNKILAIYTGPNSFAYISQLQNIVNISLVLPSNSVNSACVKYTAETQSDEERYRLWKSCSFIVFLSSFIVSLCLILFSGELSRLTFGTKEHHVYFLYLAVSLHFIAFNAHFQSIFNGLGKLKEYVLSSIISNLLSAGISIGLIIFFGLHGALLSIIGSQIFGVIITYRIGLRIESFSMNNVFGKAQFKNVKKILSFSVMAIFAGAILPISLSIMRQMIINTCGIESASYWDGVWKISTIYMTLISTTLSVYYLPKLSALNNKKDLSKEITTGLIFVLIISAFSALFIYILRYWVVQFLFSKDFIPMVGLIKYQLFGDVIKMITWVLGYFLISKACVADYIKSELLQWTIFISVGYVLLNKYGVEGAIYSYVLTQSICLIVLTYYVLKFFKNNYSK